MEFGGFVFVCFVRRRGDVCEFRLSFVGRVFWWRVVLIVRGVVFKCGEFLIFRWKLVGFLFGFW